MRYMLDTNIVLFMASDPTRLSKNVLAILEDYDNTFCISVETVRELIVNYNNGDIASRTWHNADEMIDAIKHQYYIDILTLSEEHMRTYAHLHLNISAKHKDPSDHVIISHAITNRIPLISSDKKFSFYISQGLDLIENN